MSYNDWIMAELERDLGLNESELEQLESILESDYESLEDLSEEESRAVDEWLEGCNGYIDRDGPLWVFHPLGEIPYEYETLKELVDDAKLCVEWWHKEGFYPYEL